MTHPFRRAPSLANRRVVVRGFYASLLALACGSSSDGSSSDGSSPREPLAAGDPSVAPGDDPRALPADTDVLTPAAPPVSDTPAAPPISDTPAAPPVDEPQPARQCDTAVTFDDLYASVDDDLNAEGGDGIFLRYVSLSNRLNQGICPEDLEGDRQALIKALNSLSTEVRIALPEAIDADRTLFRVDLRDLGWDQPTVVDGVAFNDRWEAILAASPYAVEFEGDEADEAKLNANTTVPLLSADALIDAAMIGNLYYALIDVGESEDALLAQLGIDEEEQEERQIVVKAGTSRSRLSRQNTVAERLEVELFQGYYWARYDIAADNGGESIFANPLDFQQDSIAAVFSLPNGLNGYVLFDGAGVRQVDTDVIVDQAQRDGRVRNSVSCSQCHAAGINPMTDEVRQYAEANPLDFDGDTFEEVLDAFPEQATIDDKIREDSELYHQALSRAGVDAASDPVSATYLRFDGDVTLGVAAGELGVTADVLDRNLAFLSNQVDPILSSLGARSLQREQFDAVYLATLCALQAPSGNRPAAAACAAVGQ